MNAYTHTCASTGVLCCAAACAQPLKLDIKRVLSVRSDRVKSIDIHPTNPWVLCALYSGHVHIWETTTQNLLKTFEISELPCRAAKFAVRENWFVASSDDLRLSVFNYNTHEKVTGFEAHTDYIRSVAVHPTLPLVLSSSDDMSIKLWDWSKNWANTMVFEGHTHYVMMVVFNPKDTNTFATASLDRTIKVWSISAKHCNYTLSGHEKGLNCVDYFAGGEKPYLISGSDDKTVRIWDYQTKTCVHVLKGHTHNVASVAFHPTMPLLLTGSEDGTVRMWHSATYRHEHTLNYGMGRVWSIFCSLSSNAIAMGYDEGAVMITLGKEEPAVSMDNTGKIVWATPNKEVLTANVKAIELDGFEDGDVLPLGTKELGTCELSPQVLMHNPNGRFVVVAGDGEYIVYTARAWRNKDFGQAIEFVWSINENEYATRDASNAVRIAVDGKDRLRIKVDFTIERMFGGAQLTLATTNAVFFYDWATGTVLRKIDAVPKRVFWSESGEYVVLACDDAFFVLKFHAALVNATLASGAPISPEGIEGAFDVVFDCPESVETGVWIGEVFLYTNKMNRLSYCVGSETVTVAHLDRPMYLLGYLAKDNRVFLMDKDTRVVSYRLMQAALVFQTAVVRGDFATASRILPEIPVESRNRIARFLEAQGHVEQALAVSLDPEHRFDLAMSLKRIDLAREIAAQDESELKWRQLADLCISQWNFDLAEECLIRSNSLSGLLLFYSSLGNRAGMLRVAAMATKAGQNNIAFVSLFLADDVHGCLDLLCETGRVAEAAFLARTYAPSQISRIVALWRASLGANNARAAEALADPLEYENLFPDLGLALQAEAHYATVRSAPMRPAASTYETAKAELDRDIVEEARAGRFADAVALVLARPPQDAPASGSPVKAPQARQSDTPAEPDDDAGFASAEEDLAPTADAHARSAPATSAVAAPGSPVAAPSPLAATPVAAPSPVASPVAAPSPLTASAAPASPAVAAATATPVGQVSSPAAKAQAALEQTEQWGDEDLAWDEGAVAQSPDEPEDAKVD